MKLKCCFISFVLAASLGSISASQREEEELLEVLATTLLQSSAARDVEPANQAPGAEVKSGELKPLEAFETKFLGKATFNEAALESVTYWCEDASLAPEAASKLFVHIADLLRQKLGEGTWVKDVPSFEDASDPKKQVMLWSEGPELVVLSVDVYPTRAGLSLQRLQRSTWIAQMGADQGAFWDKALKGSGIAVAAQPLTTESPLGEAQGRAGLKAQPEPPPAALMTIPEQNPTSVREKIASIPWSAWIAVSAVFVCLMWVWAKRRK